MNNDRPTANESGVRADHSAIPRSIGLDGRRQGWLLVACAFLIPLIFAIYTGHIWEDYFVTLRSSRNLVEGHGLVFSPGERLQTFTSPLGALLPALVTWIVGPGREQTALWLFRIASAGLLAAGTGLLWWRVTALGLGVAGRFLLFGLVLADPKLTDFSVNGMETGILVFFALLLWTELEKPQGPRTVPLALAFAGLMWTRPDAFVLAGAICLPQLLLRNRKEAGGIRWSPLAGGSSLAVLLYAPWFIWAWRYYGSPIPHTITAKIVYLEPTSLRNLALMPLRLIGYGSPVDALLLPSYCEFGGWPTELYSFAHVLAGASALLWLIPAVPLAGRRASFAVFVGAFYLGSIKAFPWYLPPWALLVYIALAFGFDRLLRSWAVEHGRPVICRSILALGVAVVAVQAVLLVCVARQTNVHQDLIENHGRRDVGEWLRENAAPRDRVFLEPLGYIGYYSQLKTYDFPGLSSREVVAEVQTGRKKYAEIVADLRPEWLVLRPVELRMEGFTEQQLSRDYRLVKVFDNKAKLDSVPLVPGRRYLEFDSQFFVFRRQDAFPAK